MNKASRAAQRYNEKALRGDANTARWLKAEPKILAPPQIPFPGAQDGQNLISSATNPVW